MLRAGRDEEEVRRDATLADLNRHARPASSSTLLHSASLSSSTHLDGRKFMLHVTRVHHLDLFFTWCSQHFDNLDELIDPACVQVSFTLRRGVDGSEERRDRDVP